MNHKFRSFVYICVLAGLLLGACDQSPIFFEISQEVKPTDPRIEGNPTHIVEIGDSFYVASRFDSTVYRYYTKNSSGTYENGTWSTIPLSGDILELATDGTYLYALTGKPVSSSTVWKYEPDPDPSNPSDPLPQPSQINLTVSGTSDTLGFIQTIYGTTGKLFASTSTQLAAYDDSSNNWTELMSTTNLLNGAAKLNSTYYLAVKTAGIYTWDGTTLSPDVLDETRGDVVAIMPVGDRLVALYRNGILLYSDDTAVDPVTFSEKHEVSIGSTPSGSISLWKEDPNDAANTNHILLVGTKGSSVSTRHGYRELPLTGTDPFTAGPTFSTPGNNSPSSVDNTDRYNSTIGIHVITAMHQAKDGILFAATTKNGLWSYRNRDNKNVWNAEE